MIKKSLGVVLALFVFYVIFDIGIRPRINDINDDRDAYVSATEATRARTLAASSADRAQVAADLEAITIEIPPAAEQKAIIGGLVEVFTAAGVEWRSGSATASGDEGLVQFTPGPTASRGQLLGVELPTSLEGSLDAVRNALDGIAELDRYYTIDGLSLSWNAEALADDAGINAAPDQVTVTLEATTWVWVPSEPAPLPIPAPETADAAEEES